MKNVTPYPLDDEAVRSDAAVSVISSIGLTAVIVWADLLGHGFGFAPSSSIIQQLGNARLFFLVGFTLCAIGSVLLARAPQRKTQVLTKAAPTAAFLGARLLILRQRTDYPKISHQRFYKIRKALSGSVPVTDSISSTVKSIK